MVLERISLFAINLFCGYSIDASTSTAKYLNADEKEESETQENGNLQGISD